ncbi:MAG: glycosyltransferase [Chloroflexota bacterium]
MRVLVIHNTYQIPGGEQVTVNNEIENLRAHGHEVITYMRDNSELGDMGSLGKLAMPKRMAWSKSAAADLRALVQRTKPDIAHIHNTHFMISPAAVHVCADEGVPVVKTLHNFRLICPAATLFRNGRVCEDCVGKAAPLPGVLHACFRRSHSQSAALAAANTFHVYRKTWDRVAQFITPTAFARAKMIEGGFAPDRITAKPHFLATDPGIDAHTPRDRFMLYVGRFTPEKGSQILLEAWKTLPDIPLKMVGEGPLMADARATLDANPNMTVELLGRVRRDEVYALMRRAHGLVFSSECYETFGMVAVEAFAVGTPVVASGHGAPAEIITHGETGLHFTPGDPTDLAAKVRQMWEDQPTTETMRQKARATFEAHYTAAPNLDRLLSIYEQAKSRSNYVV